jgi:hypothetical protein
MRAGVLRLGWGGCLTAAKHADKTRSKKSSKEKEEAHGNDSIAFLF